MNIYLSGNANAEELQCGDINGDGRIAPADVQELFRRGEDFTPIVTTGNKRKGEAKTNASPSLLLSVNQVIIRSQ